MGFAQSFCRGFRRQCSFSRRYVVISEIELNTNSDIRYLPVPLLLLTPFFSDLRLLVLLNCIVAETYNGISEADTLQSI